MKIRELEMSFYGLSISRKKISITSLHGHLFIYGLDLVTLRLTDRHLDPWPCVLSWYGPLRSFPHLSI